MIQDKPFGNPMTKRESFEEFYAKKLEALKIQLKEIIKGDTPYITSETYACKVCASRVKLHAQGCIYCLCCDMPATWTRALMDSVVEIMMGYPDVDECAKEWEALHTEKPAPKERRIKTPKLGDVELGKQIREARLALGLSKRELAGKIFKEDGKNRLSAKSIEGYENGYIHPQEHILEQIKTVLGLEVTPDVQ